MEIKKGLLYSEDHEWIQVEGNIATIGISDYAQHELGEIVFIEMPGEGDEFSAGDTFGAVESVKAASDVLIPVSGTITEINESLEDDPAQVNSDPFGAWFVKVEISDESELEALMSPEGYEEFTK